MAVESHGNRTKWPVFAGSARLKDGPHDFHHGLLVGVSLTYLPGGSLTGEQAPTVPQDPTDASFPGFSGPQIGSVSMQRDGGVPPTFRAQRWKPPESVELL
jgi:hypothetical protein